MQLAVLFSAESLFGSLLKIGMMAASMAISMIGRQRAPQPIQDLKISVSSYGKAIPRVYGGWRATGNMFWSTDLRFDEVWVGKKGKEYHGKKGQKKGKKGKAQEVNVYYADFAMGLCAGPMADVLRIWCDSHLIFDKYNPGGYWNYDGVWVPVVQTGFSQRPPVTGPGVDNMSKADHKNFKKAPAQQNFTFLFYGGGEDQKKDPTMVQRSGDASTPAYRGLCYLMFPNMKLQDFGNRIPTVTAEIVVKSDPKPILTKWTLMDPAPFDVNDSRGNTFVDFQRGRIIQNDSVKGGPNNNQPCLRVWDMQQQTEIHRWILPNTDLGSLIGMDANGDCVYQFATSFTLPHGFTGGFYYIWETVNPETGQPGADLHVDAVGLGIATIFMPILGVNDEGNPQLYTVMTNDFSILWNTDGGGYVRSQTWFGAQIGQGAPGTANEALLWNRGIFYSPGKIYGMPAAGIPRSAPAADHETVFIQLPDDPVGLVYTPVYSVAANAYLVIYAMSSIINTTTKAAGFDGSGKLLWHKDLPFGPPYFEFDPKVPILRGSTYSFIGVTGYGDASSATQVLTINIQTGDFTVQQVNVGYGQLPGASGVQIYTENPQGITYWSNNGNGLPPTNPNYLGPDWYTLYFNMYTGVNTKLSDLIVDVCGAVGIAPGEIDVVSNFNDAPVQGFSIEGTVSARKTLEQLAQVYHFDVTESDKKLKVVSRGQNPRATVHQNQLGIVGQAGQGAHDTNASSHFYEETKIQEIDLPQRVDISFVDPVRDYQVGTTGYMRPTSPFPTMQSLNLMQTNVPIALSEQQAQQWSETICNASWIERYSHKFTVPPEFLKYDPTDVLFFNMDEGLTFLDRIVRLDISGDFSISMETVSQVAPYYLPPGTAPAVEDIYSPYFPVSVGYMPGSAVPNPVQPQTSAKPIVMDIPLVFDGDSSFGGSEVPFYWAAGAYSPGFKGGELSTQIPGGSWAAEGATPVDVPWGTVSGTVPSPPEGPFATDTTNVITLRPEMDYEAEGIYEWLTLTDAEWPSEKNMVLIGGEIICFKTAIVGADGAVEISTLIRGCRGTENWCNGHTRSEQFVILKQTGDRIATLPTTDVNQTISANLFAPSILQLLAPTTKITFKGNALRPYAPVNFERADSGGNSVITWDRRTRYNGALQDGTDAVPLNEDSELYRLYICTTAQDPLAFDPNAAPPTFIREVDNLTSATFTYTAAMKTADGISSLQTIYVVCYQISGEVGLGFPGVATLETNTPAYHGGSYSITLTDWGGAPVIASGRGTASGSSDVSSGVRYAAGAGTAAGSSTVSSGGLLSGIVSGAGHADGSASVSGDGQTTGGSSSPIPLSASDLMFSGNAASAGVSLPDGGSVSNKDITGTYGGVASVVGNGSFTMDHITINSDEGVRIAGTGTTVISNSYIYVNGVGLDHADGVQTYSPGDTGTVTVSNTMIELGTTAVNCGFFVADNFGGTFTFSNVVFKGGLYGLRVAADAACTVYLQNVYFITGSFTYDDFLFQNTTSTVTIAQWDNVREATIVGGVLVPGALIPHP